MSSVGRTPGVRVLVVDDEESVLTFAERTLHDAGYDVVVATTGEEAVRIAAAQQPFAVAVVDLVLPLMRGDEVARQLRRVNPDIKVLYFTGYADRLFQEKRTLWEDEAFLEKPVTIAAFREAVSLLLYGRTKGAT